MGPEAIFQSFAHENRHLGGTRFDQDEFEKNIKRPRAPDGSYLVKPGSDGWIALHRLRAQHVADDARRRWLRMLRWYKKYGYEEFCFDAICAKDLICWACENFQARNGAIYPGDHPSMTVQLLDEFCLVMEAWFSDNGLPFKVLDEYMTCYVWTIHGKELLSERAYSTEVEAAVRALEMIGRPPLKWDGSTAGDTDEE